MAVQQVDGETVSPYYSAMDEEYTSFESRGRTESVTARKGGGHNNRHTELCEPLVDYSDTDVLVSPKTEESTTFRRTRSLRKKLKKVRAGFSNKVVSDAFIDSTENVPQYLKGEYSSSDLLVRARLRMLRGVDSLLIRLLGLLMLAADVVFIIIDLTLKSGSRAQVISEVIFQILDLLFSAYFCVEVSIRIIGLGQVFLRRWFEIFDLSIITSSTVLTIIYILLSDYGVIHYQVIFGSIRLVIIGRLIRVFFWARVVNERKGIKTFVRNKVSQNKRRYIDDHFDLDLTYVTDRVIAMSFPSSGSESLYRNSIREVGEFLDKKHYGHYRVYNLCSEKEYDTSYFHNQVQRVFIDDHNVPRFTDLVDFCEDVFTWMEANSDNVIVVHCKGGKGRTGTMISAWLVRAGLFLGAGESLAYFSVRRTDKTRGSKSQGVQTPSQRRYVLYYETLLTQMRGDLPPPISLKLKTITFHGLCSVGSDNGNDWMFEILQVDEKIFQYSFQDPDMRVKIAKFKDHINDSIEMTFSEEEPVILTDDIKFKFYCSTRSIPTGNDKCHFYFWFHTTFIENNRLSLDRSELDNLQKSRIQRHYPSSFAIELDFEPLC